MIAKSVRFFENRPYANQYRRFSKNPNPAKRARIWAQIGVLQLALVLGIQVGWALPKGASIVSGEVNISGEECLTVEAGDRSVIHWREFSIEKGEKVIFVQPDANAAVLNRVVESSPSFLLGQMEANGKVVLINPRGILVGREGRIDTGAFFALSLDVHDRAFIEKGELHCREISWGMVVNEGKIEADEVCLIGFEVQNGGKIEARQTRLVGAKEIFIQDGPLKIRTRCTEEESAKLRHLIEDQGNPYSIAFKLPEDEDWPRIVPIEGSESLNMPGPTVVGKGEIRGEEVHLLGDYVDVREEALVDVSGELEGGKIYVGGEDSRIVRIDGMLKADGFWGGKVIAQSGGAMCCGGSISAQGVAEGGDVRVCGEEYLLFEGEVDVFSFDGLPGIFSFECFDE